MNVSNERKAYEEWKAEHFGFEPCPFTAWLGAKLHAKEMAKPVARIEKRKDHHQWAVYVPSSLTAEAFDFPTKEQAAEYARARGYRVEE